jgi:hypothetical protein
MVSQQGDCMPGPVYGITGHDSPLSAKVNCGRYLVMAQKGDLLNQLGDIVKRISADRTMQRAEIHRQEIRIN